MLLRRPWQRNAVQHFSNDKMGLSRGQVLFYHEPVHQRPKYGPGIACCYNLDHDPLDHRPARRLFSFRNAEPRDSASENLSGRRFSRRQTATGSQDQCCHREQGAQRPPNLSRDQRPAHRCRPAPFWVATLSAPAKYARPNPNPFSPFALTIAKHPGVAFGRLYSMRIAPLRTRSGFVHAGHDPQWRGGPFESRMLWAIVRNGQYVKCSRD